MVIFISLSRMVQAQGVSVTKIMISGTVWARVETGLWCLLTMSRNIRAKYCQALVQVQDLSVH